LTMLTLLISEVIITAFGEFYLVLAALLAPVREGRSYFPGPTLLL
jgi:hypothetical protein